MAGTGIATVNGSRGVETSAGTDVGPFQRTTADTCSSPITGNEHVPCSVR